MNVSVTNRNKELISNLGIDIMKTRNGEFTPEEIIAEFQNYFYQRMILDITAIKDYNDITNLQKLSISLDMDKVILVLDGDQTITPEYLSKLVSMGIYNFTQDIAGILYLYKNPNSYRDVAQYHQLNTTPVEEPKVIVQANPSYSMPIAKKIIGVKNITKQSGATSLIYMMKRQLEKNYSVVAIEVDKKDFVYFREKNMVSATSMNIGSEIQKYNDFDIILLDVDNSPNAEGLANEMIYLIEPSVIKLNKLTIMDPNIFNRYKNKKVILNQSMLTNKDVLDFEYETRIKMFFNMPPLNERDKNIPILNMFLKKLGFDKQKG